MFKNLLCTTQKIFSAVVETAAMLRHFHGVRTPDDLTARLERWEEIYTTKKHNCCCA